MSSHPTLRPIDDTITGDEVLCLGDREIQLVSHRRGFRFGGPEAGGVVLRLSPTRVRVRTGDALEEIVIDDPEAEALRGMLGGAMAISAICLFAIGLLRAWSSRRP